MGIYRKRVWWRAQPTPGVASAEDQPSSRGFGFVRRNDAGPCSHVAFARCRERDRTTLSGTRVRARAAEIDSEAEERQTSRSEAFAQERGTEGGAPLRTLYKARRQIRQRGGPACGREGDGQALQGQGTRESYRGVQELGMGSKGGDCQRPVDDVWASGGHTHRVFHGRELCRPDQAGLGEHRNPGSRLKGTPRMRGARGRRRGGQHVRMPTPSWHARHCGVKARLSKLSISKRKVVCQKK